MVLKRLSAPVFWPIQRKTKKYVIEPQPGPHPKAESISLGVLLRDIWEIVQDGKEIRQLLNSKAVKVDGTVRTGRGFPVGIMDIVTVGDLHYRVVPSKRGFSFQSVSPEQAKLKLLKVVNKTHVKGKSQLNFHDGRNIVVDKDIYKTGDVVLFDLETKQIKGAIQFKRGALALVTEGDNRGLLGKIEDIVVVRGPQPNRVVLKLGKTTKETLKDYAFVVGQDKPAIYLEGVSEAE